LQGGEDSIFASGGEAGQKNNWMMDILKKHLSEKSSADVNPQ